MKFTLLFFLVLFTGQTQASSTFDDVKDIEKMFRRADGFYEVTCRNGVTEIVSWEQLKNGQVCGGVQSNKKIICTGQGSIIYPTRGSDGKQLGHVISAKQCRAIVEAAYSDVVCTNAGRDFWYITRIEDEQRLGNHTSFQACLSASVTMNQQVACVPYGDKWKPTRVNDGTGLGTLTDLQPCLFAVTSARELAVCVNYGSEFWAPLRIADAAKMGFYTDLNSCTLATQRAYNGRLCVHAGGDYWRLTEIQTLTSLSDAILLDACITQ